MIMMMLMRMITIDDDDDEDEDDAIFVSKNGGMVIFLSLLLVCRGAGGLYKFGSIATNPH